MGRASHVEQQGGSHMLGAGVGQTVNTRIVAVLWGRIRGRKNLGC